eukprot:scaffold76471_cov51-Phaeocystis_antarctica.AAC.4
MLQVDATSAAAPRSLIARDGDTSHFSAKLAIWRRALFSRNSQSPQPSHDALSLRALPRLAAPGAQLPRYQCRGTCAPTAEREPSPTGCRPRHRGRLCRPDQGRRYHHRRADPRD